MVHLNLTPLETLPKTHTHESTISIPYTHQDRQIDE